MTDYRRRALALSAAILLTAVTGAAHAAKSGYYRWVDDDGNVNYTQQAPMGRESVFVATQTGKVTSSEAQQAAPQAAAAEDKSNTLPERMDVLPQKDEQRCQQGRDMLRATENRAKRFRVTDDKGESRILSPEEIEEQRKRAQEMVDLHC